MRTTKNFARLFPGQNIPYYAHTHTGQPTYQGPLWVYLALNLDGGLPHLSSRRHGTLWALWGQIDMPVARFCELGSETHLLPNWPLCWGASSVLLPGRALSIPDGVWDCNPLSWEEVGSQ